MNSVALYGMNASGTAMVVVHDRMTTRYRTDRSVSTAIDDDSIDWGGTPQIGSPSRAHTEGRKFRLRCPDRQR